MTRSLFRNTLIIGGLILSSPFIVGHLNAQSKPASTAPAHMSSAAPWLGVLLDKKTIHRTDGIHVTRIMRQSPAEKAGILSGDRILKIDDHSVQSASNLQKLVREKTVGSTIKISAMRGTQPMEFNITLTPAPTEAQMLETQLLNQPAPSVTLELISPQSRTLQLADLQGRPIIVEFWATWCQPCIAVAAELARLKTKHGDNIHVLGVSSEDATALTDYVKKSGEPPYMLAKDVEQAGHDSFFVSNYPIVFLLNAEHRIVGIYSGRSQLQQLETKLNTLLEATKTKNQPKKNKKAGP